MAAALGFCTFASVALPLWADLANGRPSSITRFLLCLMLSSTFFVWWASWTDRAARAVVGASYAVAMAAASAAVVVGTDYGTVSAILAAIGAFCLTRLGVLCSTFRWRDWTVPIYLLAFCLLMTMIYLRPVSEELVQTATEPEPTVPTTVPTTVSDRSADPSLADAGQTASTEPAPTDSTVPDPEATTTSEPKAPPCDLSVVADLEPAKEGKAAVALRGYGQNVAKCPDVQTVETAGPTTWIRLPGGDFVVITAKPIEIVDLMLQTDDGPVRTRFSPEDASIVFKEVIEQSSPAAVEMIRSGAVFPLDRGLCGRTGDAVILVSTGSPTEVAGVLIRSNPGSAEYILLDAPVLYPWLEAINDGNVIYPVGEADGERQRFSAPSRSEPISVPYDHDHTVTPGQIAKACRNGLG